MKKSQMVAVVAGCVLEQDNKYLLVQEKQQKVYGLWNLPAGHVDEGETLEAAAIRETREETGYEVALLEELCVEHPVANRSVLHAFRAKIVGGKLAPDLQELLGAQWFSFAEIMELDQQNKLRDGWAGRVIKAL